MTEVLEALEGLVDSPAAYGFVFILGALFGSFANVCIYRWPPSDDHPSGRSVVSPPSHCSACGNDIAWYDNVPLLSYLWLRGKCRQCKTEFSPRYLLVEGATAMLFVAVFHLSMFVAWQDFGFTDALVRTLVYAAFVFVLVVIVFIDLDHMLILNKVTYPSIPIFYGLGLLLPESSWRDGLIGIVVGYGIVRLISDGYFYLTGREGMGYGDGKLLAIVGALAGWKAVVFCLFAGSFIGLLVNVPLLVARQIRGGGESESDTGEGEGEGEEGEEGPAPGAGFRTEIPFGPPLAVAAIIFLFLDEWIEIEFLPAFTGGL